MIFRMKMAAVVVMMSAATAIAQTPPPAAKGNGPCEQVKMACTNAGFIAGDAKKGDGLFWDCINPIMQGTAQPKTATKPLPTVDPSVVSACKAKHPDFGTAKNKKQ